ncbi:hypothetical protein PLESTB_001756700 [Pleodorina starrii]|uniref:Uncharacterized protein n=1 Tax=Pleodorina starrii TaxID=330485 RepID=A0A9W6FA53_9CHLO|nr:hypothetical protein PLESTB_001756700 [Pleodorina starrii]
MGRSGGRGPQAPHPHGGKPGSCCSQGPTGHRDQEWYNDRPPAGRAATAGPTATADTAATAGAIPAAGPAASAGPTAAAGAAATTSPTAAGPVTGAGPAATDADPSAAAGPATDTGPTTATDSTAAAALGSTTGPHGGGSPTRSGGTSRLHGGETGRRHPHGGGQHVNSSGSSSAAGARTIGRSSSYSPRLLVHGRPYGGRQRAKAYRGQSQAAATAGTHTARPGPGRPRGPKAEAATARAPARSGASRAEQGANTEGPGDPQEEHGGAEGPESSRGGHGTVNRNAGDRQPGPAVGRIADPQPAAADDGWRPARHRTPHPAGSCPTRSAAAERPRASIRAGGRGGGRTHPHRHGGGPPQLDANQGDGKKPAAERCARPPTPDRHAQHAWAAGVAWEPSAGSSTAVGRAASGCGVPTGDPPYQHPAPVPL